jgi:hypothetical protein
MSGDHTKKEMVTGEKPATSHGKAPSRECGNKKKEGSPSRIRMHKSGEKKKKMKKVVYYETDSSSPSTSGSDAASITSKRQERKKYSKIPLRYPRIPKHTPLLLVPLGKPSTFDGEDYSRWSDMMRYHLTSLHKSIWDVVEFGVQVPFVGDEDYDEDEVAQIEHFNSQSTTILLTSLSREEYNKVQGLKSAKEIWDVLKTAHEGDEVTKITKRETIEGELGRFMLNQGEDPQAMYNRLKILVNQVCNLGSSKWDDHEMVKVILRSLIFLNPTQFQLICGDPRYKLMSPKEVIGKFVSFELMIKGSNKIIEQGTTSTPEVQPVAFKATRRTKKTLHLVGSPSTPPSSTMRRWRSSSKAFTKSSSKGGGKTTSPAPRRFATNVVSPVILSLNALCLVIVTGITTRRERGEKRRGTTRRRAAMPMFAGSGTPTRAPLSPPPTRTPPTSPSPKDSSSPTSATSASWQRTAKGRR